AEGLMNRRNSQTDFKEKSKRSGDCGIYLSLTKVNFYFKIDSSTAVCVSYEWRVPKRKEVFRNRDFNIASLLNINTRKDLKYKQVYQINLINFNKVINQYGNPGITYAQKMLKKKNTSLTFFNL